MPAFFYPGDNFAVRAEAASLLNRGTLGIPYSERDRLGDFLAEPGQYFFENDHQQRFFSKYGIGYTVLHLPPLLIERHFFRPLELLGQTPSLLLMLNLYGVLLTLISTSYLFLLAREFSRRPLDALIFTWAAVYATFVWHYMRAPALEIFQITFFLAFVYHAVRFLSSRRSPARVESGGWLHLLTAALSGGALVSMKLSFAVSLLVFIPFALLAGPSCSSRRGAIVENVRRHWQRYGMTLVLPVVAAGLLIAWVNVLKFGHALDSGYSQWLQADSIPVAHFTPALLADSFPAFFLRTGNSNVFLHFPLVLLAAPFFLRFARRHPAESAFLAALVAINILVLGSFSVWHGEWGYGPRYLLFFLIPAALPALEGAHVVSLLRNPVRRWAAAGAVAVVLGWSMTMQFRFNSLHYFAHYYAKRLLDSAASEAIGRELSARPPDHRQHIQAAGAVAQSRIARYFDGVHHRAVVHTDLAAHKNDRRVFPPLRFLVDAFPTAAPHILRALEEPLRNLAEPNFLIARKASFLLGPGTPRTGADGFSLSDRGVSGRMPSAGESEQATRTGNRTTP